MRFAMDNKKTIKSLLSVGFIFIAISGILLLYSPITGYEISIYDSTPTIVWILLFFATICGIGLVFSFVWSDERIPSTYWLLSVVLIIIARLELLYIPYLRGYITLRGDNISHIGYVLDILKNSYIGDNSYPVTHILCSEISLITSMPPISFINYMTALFSVFFVFSIYLLLKTTSVKQKTQFLAFVVAGGILFDQYNIYVMPNGWSLFFLLFILYVALQSMRCKVYSVIFVLLLVFSVFFHPLTYLMTIGILMLCTISHYVLRNSRFLIDVFDASYIRSFIIPIILSVILFTWHILSYQKFVPNFRLLWRSITSEGSGGVPIAQMGDTLTRINFDLLDFLELFIKMNGDELVYLLFLISALYLLVRRHIINRSKICINEAIFIAIPFLFGAVFVAYLLNLVPGLDSIGSARLLSFTMILTPLSAAFVLNNYVLSKNKIMAIACVILILTASLLSFLSLYPSPYVHRANPGVTNMDMSGMEWTVNTKGGDYQYVTILSPITRFADAILGIQATKIEFGKKNPTVIDHFGYNNNTYLGQYYDETTYFSATQMDQIIYDTVYSFVGRFNQCDFVRLNQDVTVDRLYHNGESFVYAII
jgi:hypothetical protein